MTGYFERSETFRTAYVCSPKVHYRLHKARHLSQSLVRLMKPTHALSSQRRSIFNIILPPTPTSSKWFFPSALYTFPFSHSSHPTSAARPTNIYRRLYIADLSLCLFSSHLLLALPDISSARLFNTFEQLLHTHTHTHTHTHKTTGKITALRILLFRQLWRYDIYCLASFSNV
jgi:hypothetical protein